MKKLKTSFLRLLAVSVVLLPACGRIQTASRDGYRALLVFGGNEKYSIAVRGEKRRVEGDFDGSKLIKVLRPELGKIWQWRPSTRKLLEQNWSAHEELVPGYPLEPHFDPQAYADRFGAQVKQIADGIHGLHPCDRYLFTLPSKDRVVVWAARDFERLVVKIEQDKREGDEFQPFQVVELLDIRTGANEDLFEKPKSYQSVGSYQELGK